ncbi:MAG TPA: hypothetical protein VJU86_19495 [Pyrinomonadaceae bacterium]|nr:hypothetical protein [Pyrinomonadaceae bacterium]
MSFISRLSQHSWFHFILILPVLLYLAVALFWHSKQFYAVTGDEPHYLLVSESLVKDHDFLVVNNYLNHTPVHQAAGLDLSQQHHLGSHTRGQYSLHNIGLPVLIAIPYAIGGVLGAKLFLALLAGLWPWLLYKNLGLIVDSRAWQVIVALALSVGLPFLAASNQLFPDLLGGMIVFYVAGRIFARTQAREQELHQIKSDLWVGCLIAFLPWIHIRFAAPALVLLLAHGYFGRSKESALSRFLSSRVLLPAILVACSLILVAFYQHTAFGSMLGPYSSSDVSMRLRDSFMIFLGFHWDQSQGMFIQQPLLLLGLVGLPMMIKENWEATILLGLVYLSILVPNAMHPAWYGGFTFQGRFWWTAFSLWVFPIAYAVRFLTKKNERLLLVLCVGSLAFQGWLAYRWVFQSAFLTNRNIPVWASTSFFQDTRLMRLLPAFRDFDTYLNHPANYVALILGGLLIISGWVWLRGNSRALSTTWVVFLVLGFCSLMFLSPALGNWKITAAELPSQIGTTEGKHRVATEKDGPGVLIFGPYALLVAGSYQIDVDYESSGPPESSAGRFSVVYDQGRQILVDTMLPPADPTHGKTTQTFTVGQDQSIGALFEFPVRYTGQGSLRVKGFTVKKID